MVFSNNLLMGAGGQASGYEIDQSIRFNDDDSAHLSFTPSSAGNRRTWTFSAWVKRANITDGRQTIFSANNNAYLQLGPDAASREMITILNEGSGTDLNWYTTQVFRDPAAWFHVVWQFDSTQSTADDRTKLYINGTRVTSFTKGATPDQNLEGAVNNNVEHKIGEAAHAATFYLDAYLAEIHFIDGTALTASSFGETNSSTGQWVPINYSGSYGTNGFYLKGQDSSALGDDSSGNGNDFSSSGMSAADQVTDTPTDNHCVLNALDGAGTLSDGNLVNAATTSSFVSRRATIGVPSSGKWAFRVKKSANNFMVGVMAPQATDGDPDTNGVDAVFYYDEDGTSSGDIQTRRSGSKVVETTDPPAGIAADTFMEVLIDKDNNRLGVVIGGTAYIAVDSGVAIQDTMTQIFVSTEGSGVTATVDFGQSGFTPSQTGYKALSTANLDDPTIVDPSKYFQPTLYTGNGSTQSIDQSGNSTFQPDWVWIKNRDAADSHVLTDAVRGATKIISSDSSAAEATDADTLTAFESDGFALGDDDKVNTNTEKYVAWQWKANGTGGSNGDGDLTATVSANTTAGFSIIKYQGTGSATTVGHGLGVAPKMIIVKDLDNSRSFNVYHDGLTAATKVIYLDQTAAESTDAAIFGSAPTSSVVNIATGGGSNGSGNDYIMYAFAEVEGFSKFGSYTGNNNADGTFVYTGFKPAFLIYKVVSTTDSWEMYDGKRLGFNVQGEQLKANLSNAETDDTRVDILSNGFKARSTNTAVNASQTYLYMAFAETPFKTATAR